MMSLKQERLASLIQKYSSDIIQFELKNISIGIVTVTRVRVSDDNSWAKVYISFLADNKQERLEILEIPTRFIRSSLAKRLTIRTSPDSVFEIDTSFEEGQYMYNVLKDTNEED